MRTRLVVLALLGALCLPALTPSRAVGQEATPVPKKTVNVEFILDASGSMAEGTDTGETRMDASKRVLAAVIEAIPERKDINVGFRLYGYEGDNSEDSKAVSCKSSKLSVKVSGVDKGKLRAAIDQAQPTGWTPITLSLKRAAKDFPKESAAATNVVVLLTDGAETCGGDPCKAAADLHAKAGLAMVTDVVGFGTSPEDQDRLGCIAKNGGGQLFGAGSATELQNALFAVLKKLDIVAGPGYVGGNAFPLVPAGEPGKLSVVAYGPPDPSGFGMPFVARNATAEDVDGLKVTVTIRDAAGGLVGAGSELSVQPYHVVAGGLAIGSINIGQTQIPDGATYEFKVQAAPSQEVSSHNQRDLSVVEANGSLDHVVATLQNTQEQSVKGPISGGAACFDENGTLLSFELGSADVVSLNPGDTQSFQADVLQYSITGVGCPLFLIAGYAYS